MVIRRGERPRPTNVTTVGRIGGVGKSALEKEAMGKVPVKELLLDGDYEQQKHEELVAAAEKQPASTAVAETQSQSEEELHEALRLEAFGWPRLVFPPMKRSGHVILDSCTAEGLSLHLVTLSSPILFEATKVFGLKAKSCGSPSPSLKANNPTTTRASQVGETCSHMNPRMRLKSDTSPHVPQKRVGLAQLREHTSGKGIRRKERWLGLVMLQLLLI